MAPVVAELPELPDLPPIEEPVPRPPPRDNGPTPFLGLGMVLFFDPTNDRRYLSCKYSIFIRRTFVPLTPAFTMSLCVVTLTGKSILLGKGIVIVNDAYDWVTPVRFFFLCQSIIHVITTYTTNSKSYI